MSLLESMKAIAVGLAAVIVVLAGIRLTAGTVSAECAQDDEMQCDVALLALGADIPVRSPSSSDFPICLTYMTETYYEFRIGNHAGRVVRYAIDGQEYSLEDDASRRHKLLKDHGSSSCDIVTADRPTIEFDYSDEDGHQARTYAIGDYPHYAFRESGTGLDLYLANGR